MLIALLTVVPFAAFDLRTDALFDMRVLLIGLSVGVLSSAVPYSLEMVAFKHVPAKNFGLLQSLSPVVAALAGWLILKETLSPRQCVAIASILIASAGSTLSMKPKVAEVILSEPIV